MSKQCRYGYVIGKDGPEELQLCILDEGHPGAHQTADDRLRKWRSEEEWRKLLAECGVDLTDVK